VKSAPRPPGAAMLVGPDGTAVGSVSGGCVEGAVYDLASEIRDGRAPVLQRYGVSDDDAFAVGLTCGGIIDVYVERISPATFPELDDVAADVRDGRPVAVVTLVDAEDAMRGRRLVVRPESVSGSLGSQRLDDAVRDDARGLLEQGRSAVIRYGRDGERRRDDIGVFVASHAPRPRLIVFGAIDFAAAVARIGSFLGYRVTVCDAGRCSPRRGDSGRGRGRRRVAAQVPRPHGDRRAHRGLRAHPRPEVRRAAARGGAAPTARLRRRDGLTPHEREPARAAARARLDRGGAGTAARNRSGWTSARALPRRQPCRWPPRSWRRGGAAPARRCGTSAEPSTPNRLPV